MEKIKLNKIIEILENYEYDLTHFSFEDCQNIRDKYDGEIDNLLTEIANKIVLL